MAAKRVGTLHFWLDDDREVEYNESIDLSYGLYLEDEDDEILEIGKFVDYCMLFAKAMGFAEQTVEEAFGYRR